MQMDVTLEPPERITALRELYRKEMNCQIILDSWHAREWTDSYLLRLNGQVVGYASVGGIRADPKNTVTEFYLLPIYRGAALPLFHRLVAVSRVTRIEAQTNDVLLTLMLFDCATTIERNEVLFHDALTTHLSMLDATFRKITEADRARISALEPDCESGWLLEAGGEIVATGGILFHYNVPYGDIYMAVAESFRRRGYGSYLVQELKRTCYEMGRIPAARCNATNAISRATLQKAGLLPCARLLVGHLPAVG